MLFFFEVFNAKENNLTIDGIHEKERAPKSRCEKCLVFGVDFI